MHTRKDYIDGGVTHEEYYSQFVTPELKRVISTSILSDVKQSKNRNLNDISFGVWDKLAFHIPHDIIRAVYEANKNTSGKSIVSLSDRVCILKCAARSIKKELT